jgi:hypothetical protein
MSDIAANYLRDLGFLLRERLEEAKTEAESSPQSSQQFEAGRYRAYREVIALMLSQAEVFQLTPDALAFESIDRDADLGC